MNSGYSGPVLETLFEADEPELIRGTSTYGRPDKPFISDYWMMGQIQKEKANARRKVNQASHEYA